jgi:hypothetical protein
MTQVISVITKDYALLASDRRLTIAEGPRRGTPGDDDTCKLVNVCNTFGIGYSGWSHFEGSPTHEWIAKTLASANCCDSHHASQLLKDQSTRIFSALKPSRRVHQEFLISGWGLFKDLSGLHPFMRLVTNVRDGTGQALPQPSDTFAALLKVLVNDEPLFCRSIGQPVRQIRAEQLLKNLQRLAKREIGPKAALRLLVDEIVHTSLVEKNSAVGFKVLGFCIAKSSVQRKIETGSSVMVAKQPDKESVTFTYFEPGFSELQQYGPTYVCGETAVTDVKTENDPARDFQSAQVRILSMPKAKR